MLPRDEDLLILAGVGESLRRLITHTYRTGSNYTCNPPVENTDIDLYALVPSWQRKAMEDGLAAEGWEDCLTESGGQAYVNTPGFGTEWMAYRKENYNLIVTYDWRHFVRCAAATELCKALNLTDKNDRIMAHSLVHLDKDTETKLPTNPSARAIVNILKSAGMWEHKPPTPVSTPTPAPVNYSELFSEALAQSARPTRAERYAALDDLMASQTAQLHRY